MGVIQATEGLNAAEVKEGGSHPPFLPHWWAGTSHLTSCPGTGVYTIGSPGTQAFELRLNYSSLPVSNSHTADCGTSPPPSPGSGGPGCPLNGCWMTECAEASEHGDRRACHMALSGDWIKHPRPTEKQSARISFISSQLLTFACCVVFLLSLLFLFACVFHQPCKTLCRHCELHRCKFPSSCGWP